MVGAAINIARANWLFKFEPAEFVLYQGGDNHAFERIKNNDRFYTRLEYAF